MKWHLPSNFSKVILPSLLLLPGMNRGGVMGRQCILSDGTVAWGRGEGSPQRSEQAQEAISAGRTSLEKSPEGLHFFDVLLPPPWLVVVGAGEDSGPWCPWRRRWASGWRVVDHRSSYAAPSRFPDAAKVVCQSEAEPPSEFPLGASSYVVLKTHSLERDRAWLHAAVSSHVRYIGLLGPRARKEELLRDVSAEGRSKVYGPCGLDLGGEGPEQVALSILGEVMAVQAGRSPGHLRDRESPIH